jgi:hypothetical protein
MLGKAVRPRRLGSERVAGESGWGITAGRTRLAVVLQETIADAFVFAAAEFCALLPFC